MAAGHNLNARRRTAPNVFLKRGDEDARPSSTVVANPWRPAHTSKNVKSVSCFVDNLEDNLIRVIERYGQQAIVVGCVAWLSNPRIIGTLATNTSGALIIVNDENFATWGGGLSTLSLFAQLPKIKAPLSELFAHMPSSPLALLHEHRYAPVRCVRNTGNALMHSKYLVFFRKNALGQNIPCATWTGSMNYTKQASRNQENAIFIEDEEIAQFYFNDFSNTFLQSSPLRTTGPSTTDTVNNDRPAPPRPVLPLRAPLQRPKPKPGQRKGKGLVALAAQTRPPVPLKRKRQ